MSISSFRKKSIKNRTGAQNNKNPSTAAVPANYFVAEVATLIKGNAPPVT
jgi:hypothetical protein